MSCAAAIGTNVDVESGGSVRVGMGVEFMTVAAVSMGCHCCGTYWCRHIHGGSRNSSAASTEDLHGRWEQHACNLVLLGLPDALKRPKTIFKVKK